MEKYEVYWKDFCIGTLFVDREKNKHKYVINEEEIPKAEIMNPVLLTSREWGEEIPFFKERLENSERFPDLKIGFHTDLYYLKRIP